MQAPYTLDDPYLQVDPYMINGVSFYEHLEVINMEALEFHAVISHLNSKKL